jgi:hypothetical protein
MVEVKPGTPYVEPSSYGTKPGPVNWRAVGEAVEDIIELHELTPAHDAHKL